jgi:hypothetical protein
MRMLRVFGTGPSWPQIVDGAGDADLVATVGPVSR